MSTLKKRLLLVLLILPFMFQSCAGMKNPARPVPQPKGPVQTSTPAGPSPQASHQTPTQPGDQARKHAEAGEYQKAIALYHDACSRQQEASLSKEYAHCISGIRATADRMMGKGDLPEAGKLYYVLQSNYPKFKEVEQMLSFDEAYLNAKLDHCRKTLSRQGFEEYRKGNLDRAIALWQGLLAIDPQNGDMRETVRTAIQQRKNLQEND